jgi:transcriptional regulator with XRE-family HTH domain
VPPHPEQARVLKQARAKVGLSQLRVAEAVGISQPYLCRLEAGTRAPSPRTAGRLGGFYGVPVPLPLIDFALTAAGRHEAERQGREERAERARQAAIPKLEPYLPTWLPYRFR